MNFKDDTLYSPSIPSFYGPDETTPSAFTDLANYAFSLSWQSLSQDPTGFILMGTRYYDPKTKRFLSADPVGYPLCLNLYSYANNDPVNFSDPDGRFASSVYQTSKSILIDTIRDLPPYKQLGQLGRAAKYTLEVTNSTGSFIAKNSYSYCNFYSEGSFAFYNGSLGFTNGINNSSENARPGALQISQYAGGAQVLAVYNASRGSLADVLECAVQHLGICTFPCYLLQAKWDHLIKTRSPSAKFLEICHSGGASQIKAALANSSKSVQQRIIVLAIAPSVIIPNELCFKSYNYMSRRDFVTITDIPGLIKYGSQLKFLKPHPDAKVHDHAFLSPTFKELIEWHIQDYIGKYGEDL